MKAAPKSRCERFDDLDACAIGEAMRITLQERCEAQSVYQKLKEGIALPGELVAMAS